MICPHCHAPIAHAPAKLGLTPKQQEVLEAIRSLITFNGVSPSFNEIVEALGVSNRSRVHQVVLALEERGHIRRIPFKARSIQLVEAEP